MATIADLRGSVERPAASNWQVLVNLVRNAFFEAILPGFERERDGRGAAAGRGGHPTSGAGAAERAGR